ncbi:MULTISPECIES: HAMP domain-containing protein [Burkholderia]|jgi:HAMP domain-containing protein|uniref:HAMP domain-containing protein n=2 Tax=Burkholderia contaminans TaxID=488447 RepID=A0A1E3FT70_9BURK|nr:MULTISPECIES: HAMP domain-containing protein [Burkholderia]UTP27157.1 HAMP domain-containing protein [Burkholderia sp. FXe9]KKL41827.1 hypothetical protein WR31_07310 [Burkholderia contaminans LMG 23361]MBA9832908.1 HAMP domain-containing protein [Burkholderia contaminans]MBA9841144.1 HAMP domain-containing protein [Burkholderia contaminans]MBA9866476.1 HAMP domain-containing protein [Burkholderia contaminans]
MHPPYRRIVTGHNAAGKAVIVSDGASPRGIALLTVATGGALRGRALQRPLASLCQEVEKIELELALTRLVPVLRRDEIGSAVQTFNRLLVAMQQGWR